LSKSTPAPFGLLARASALRGRLAARRTVLRRLSTGTRAVSSWRSQAASVSTN